MNKYFFRTSILIMVATVALVIITPVLSFNSLVYPVRIDSSYVSQQQIRFEKQLSEKGGDSSAVFIFSPEQLNIPYMEIAYTLRDSITLRGWMALDTIHKSAPLLLIVPDITEGAINYIPTIQQFCDRGFNVCVINLRGQGNSDGDFYTPGITSSLDVLQLIRDLRKMPFIEHVALMGIGTGAGIALKSMVDSIPAEVLILQNPPANLSRYFQDKAIEEWGEIVMPLLPAFHRAYKTKTGVNVDNYDYEELIKKVKAPHLVVAANFMKKKTVDEALEIYHASTHYKKRLYIDANSFRKQTGPINDKAYYDRIAAFINSSMPSKTKRTRFYRLATM